MPWSRPKGKTKVVIPKIATRTSNATQGPWRFINEGVSAGLFRSFEGEADMPQRIAHKDKTPPRTCP